MSSKFLKKHVYLLGRIYKKRFTYCHVTVRQPVILVTTEHVAFSIGESEGGINTLRHAGPVTEGLGVSRVHTVTLGVVPVVFISCTQQKKKK